jgi:hypothetical protein
MGAVLSLRAASRPIHQKEIHEFLNETSAEPCMRRKPAPFALLTDSHNRVPTLLVCTVSAMLIDHPWARLLAPSQLVEIHEVFSKFGEPESCASLAS